jgi:hypothetical protein
MEDPSFILNGSGARDLRELARDLQALLDSRTAAIEHPVSVPDILLPLGLTTEADRDELLTLRHDDQAPPGHRVGTGTTSILPYLVKTLAAKPAAPRG